MGRLVYTVLASLDGFVADESGRFDWAEPGEDVHRPVNELEATVGTYLYGRRLYEVMAAWQDVPGGGHGEGVEAACADVCRSADKVVHSSTLKAVTTPRTGLKRSFDPPALHRRYLGRPARRRGQADSRPSAGREEPSVAVQPSPPSSSPAA
jgi:hypothetical protein